MGLKWEERAIKWKDYVMSIEIKFRSEFSGAICRYG